MIPSYYAPVTAAHIQQATGSSTAGDSRPTSTLAQTLPRSRSSQTANSVRPFTRAGVLCNNIKNHIPSNGLPTDNIILNMAASASTAAGVSVGIVQGFPGAVG